MFAYLGRRRHRVDEAEDLTQGFFAHLLSKHVLERAEPQRGRLRSPLEGLASDDGCDQLEDALAELRT